MSKKKLTGRALRRDLERKTEKLSRDLDRLAALAPGGAPDRPIELASASQVEVHARSIPCARCQGEVRIEAHTAETISADRLRVVRVVCTMCRSQRALYFRVGTPPLN